MTATILSIGDELLIGQVVNTNAAWLGEHLDGLGIDVGRVLTLGDDAEAIQAALSEAVAQSALVIVTGGLGPTHDDLTLDAVADYLGVGFTTHPLTLERITARFARRGQTAPERTQRLAQVPEGCDVLPNPVGLAPGLWATPGEGTVLVVLPGVPPEMKALFYEEVEPRLRERADLHAIRHRTLLTAGIGESHLQEALGDLTERLGTDQHLAFLPGPSGVRLRLTATGEDQDVVKARLDALEQAIREHAGAHIFGEGEALLEGVVGQMLRECGYSIAVAESCTGGLMADRITNVPGASTYMRGGVVAYCNSVKVDLLGVDRQALTGDGAVSETVARQMARGVRRALVSEIGISTTGIAGPTGGTPDKPVGTVWIGYADAEGTFARCYYFTDERILNKQLSTTVALDLVRRRLLGIEEG
ncbi:MAG: competence/damage-inducible protein A [Bacteroidetes bacterium]|jgi:nicotinamide-nucleotide amidase|nr:competence/damage-inducible protein A [Bacteroidota bacterium]